MEASLARFHFKSDAANWLNNKNDFSIIFYLSDSKITVMDIITRKLTTKISKSVTSVSILQNGDFEVDFYDYSCSEDSAFSHDYIIKNIVKSSNVPQMKFQFSGDSHISDEDFLDLICQKFFGRKEIEQWCQENAIPYEYLYEHY